MEKSMGDYHRQSQTVLKPFENLKNVKNVENI